MRIGEVDCVIGTHRLLSEDIQFKDLGLLVVDEEQRFGVSHKEQIKQLTTNVDVLTLTATPIPRTLEMSLTGIRDLTLLNTPPAERQPILTYVGEQDERADRRGHPPRAAARGPGVLRAQPGAATSRTVAARAPRARARGPGRGGPRPDGRGHASSRSSSTSGRAGTTCWSARRSSSRASTCRRSTRSWSTGPTCSASASSTSCGAGSAGPGSGPTPTCSTRRDRALTEEAYERLKTIGEATELGSGFRIAMRDLEIRGAGTLLGTGQSGHIAAVGYDLYCQMVNEAVAELKGEEPREPAEVKLDLPLDAHLPRRLRRRRRSCGSRPTGGWPRSPPRPRSTTSAPSGSTATARCPSRPRQLLEVARLRAECHRLGVREVNVTKGPAFGGPALHRPGVAADAAAPARRSGSTACSRARSTRRTAELVVLPIPKTPDLAATLVDLLRKLVPMSD